jgi:hypothetical protein
LTDPFLPLSASVEVSGLTANEIGEAVKRGEIRTQRTEGRRGSVVYSREDLLRVSGILR